MEVNNQKYIFVIENASYNKKKIYNTVFNVSTNQIVKNNVSKHLVKLPIHKKLHKVRFDIDSSDIVSGSLTVNSTTSSGTVTTFKPSFKLTFQYSPDNQNSIIVNSFSASGSGNGLAEWNTFAPLLKCPSPYVQCNFGACLLPQFSFCPVTAQYDYNNKKINMYMTNNHTLVTIE